MVLYMILAIIILVVIVVISMYNGLVILRNRIKNAWSQIDVQLKRRYDLIPNLVNVCKGYMDFEKDVLESVIKARGQAIDVKGGAAEQAKAENFLTQTLRSLFAVVENYPDLKANQNMLSLQEELTSTENKISFSRQHYNDQVMQYNTQIETFPTNMVANTFNFKREEFFEIDDGAQRNAVKVQF